MKLIKVLVIDEVMRIPKETMLYVRHEKSGRYFVQYKSVTIRDKQLNKYIREGKLFPYVEYKDTTNTKGATNTN